MTPPPPIACTLSPDELRARRDDLLPGLVARAAQVTSVPGGIQLRLASSPDVLGAVARVLDAERRCCRFLTFTITAEADLGPVTVTVTAPPEAQALLADLLASAM